MHFWTLDNLRAQTGGTWLQAPDDASSALSCAGIDSRTLEPGQVFIAIVGDRFDGHDFLRQAEAAGAALLIVSNARKWTGGRAPVLLVRDTVAALQDMALAFRQVLGDSGTKVIAVAGSNGKTTTRHLIHTVLSSRLTGTESPRSFNNHVGVPLTLLAAATSDDYVVCEIGTNHPGEMGPLARIVQPDAAVVTSLGEEHLEFFGSEAAVAEEEAQILRFLKTDGMAAIAQTAYEAISGVIRLDGFRVVRFGENDAHEAPHLKMERFERDPDTATSRFYVGSRRFVVPLVGRHNAHNALAAVAVGRWMGIDEKTIAMALQSARPMPMRMDVRQLGDTQDPLVLINDAYNANPDSMRQALRVLTTFRPPGSHGRRVAVLGDMLEMGVHGPSRHRSVGRLIARPGRLTGDHPSAHGGNPDEPLIDLVITIGPLAMLIGEALGENWPSNRIHRFGQWSEDVSQRVAKLLCPGDVALLKASRGMALERLVPEIERRLGVRYDECRVPNAECRVPNADC